MKTVTSKDGTTIAYDRLGSGPPLILVDGALCSRANGPNGPLARLLQQHFTVYTYDRRGRGDSGSAGSYRTDREIEDISALIDEAGGSVFMYGISSGAALALEAAHCLPSVRKLALYEAPFVTDDSRPPVPDSYVHEMEELLAADRRSAAIKLFMRKGVGVPVAAMAIMPLMPAWSKLKAAAHTLRYDTLLTIEHQKGKKGSLSRWATFPVPALVAAGGKSPAWIRNAMRALAETIPNAQLKTLTGQTHIVKPAALAPVLTEYFQEA